MGVTINITKAIYRKRDRGAAWSEWHRMDTKNKDMSMDGHAMRHPLRARQRGVEEDERECVALFAVEAQDCLSKPKQQHISMLF